MTLKIKLVNNEEITMKNIAGLYQDFIDKNAGSIWITFTGDSTAKSIYAANILYIEEVQE